MTVRREIVEPRRETGVRSPEAPIRTRALQGGSEGEPALRRLRHAWGRVLQSDIGGNLLIQGRPGSSLCACVHHTL